jgi:hypothetical protein
VKIVDDKGREIKHTPEQVSAFFDEELERILQELPGDAEESVRDLYREARRVSERMIKLNEFDPI